MELFVQAAAAILLAVIVYLVLGHHSKDLALLLTVAVCCMVLTVAGRFIRPVLEFLEHIRQIGGLNEAYFAILLKVVGIGILTEIAAMVCTDAGNATLAKALQMLSSCVILWLSIPLMDGLLELVREILGGI